MRVLIIDDDTAHGETLSDLLTTRGHEAYFSPSLDEAGWLLDLFRFQVALLDYDMPDMTGPQVAQQLATRDPDLHPIVMSARSVNRQRVGSKMPFVEKPIRIDELIGMMTHLVAGRSLIVRVEFPLLRTDPAPDETSTDSTEATGDSPTAREGDSGDFTSSDDSPHS
ncbi:MAG: response regulator [Planctomycetota bacterium]